MNAIKSNPAGHHEFGGPKLDLLPLADEFAGEGFVRVIPRLRAAEAIIGTGVRSRRASGI